MTQNLRPLFLYFKQNLPAVALGLICLILVDFLLLYVPRIIKRSVDSITYGTASSKTLLMNGLAIAGIAVIVVGFRFLWRVLILGHARFVERELRERLFGHLLTLSLPYFQRTKTGDLMAHAINDIEAVRMACGLGVVAFTDGLVLGLAAIGFMLAINIKLTIISLLPTPALVILGRSLSAQMHRQFRTVQKIFSDLTETVRESFAGIRVLKAYNREAWEHQRLKEVGEQYISNNMKLAKTTGLFFPLMMLFTNLSLAVVIWLGGGLTIVGAISTGDFVAFMSYLNLLAWPMMAMGWVITLIQRGSASMGRINKILEERPEIHDCHQPMRSLKPQGLIEIRNLTFAYPGQSKPALNHVSLTVPPGHTVALVGKTGSGKTTLLELLLRLIEPPSDTIFLDGIEIKRLALESLRKIIGIVPQESFLFSETIRQNLTLGANEYSEEELLKVLDAAELATDVASFPKGLDTLLGERGLTLSGGQRQRLTIARALLINPPILVLDDALASVDTRTEERILNNLFELRADKVNLIVSHRLSTIRRAHAIYVFKDGDLIEQGTHESLMELDSEYARLYRRQLLAEQLEQAA
jgi:ATP-binding cassette subfamily B multidrug efflux pump